MRGRPCPNGLHWRPDLPAQGTPATQPKKVTTIEYESTLLANATFTGSWHDSQADGVNFVTASVFGSNSSTSGGFQIQESDDITNANFTHIAVQLNTITVAGSLIRIWSPIKARWWRIIFINNVTTQTSLEITSCATNVQINPELFSQANSSGIPEEGFSVAITTN